MKPHKIYADMQTLDGKALAQFYDALSQAFTIRGALMPDAHVGYSLPIGAVMQTQDTIVPAWVGYDIGCGMCAVRTSFSKEDVQANSEDILADIYGTIPLGFNHRQEDVPWDYDHIPRTDAFQELFNRNGLRQIGTLGGGNHFIEIGYDEEDFVWIITHSGSRGIGHATATHYMKLACGSAKLVKGTLVCLLVPKKGRTTCWIRTSASNSLCITATALSGIR